MPQVVGPTELALPDGRVLGHRSMQRYYRQAPRRVMAQGSDEINDQAQLQERQQDEQAPDDVGGSAGQLQDAANQPGQRVVAAGPPPIDRLARSEATKGDVRRDRQRFKASDAKGKIAGGRAVMWQVGL